MKLSSIEFHENLSIGSRFDTRGYQDMTKPKDPFLRINERAYQLFHKVRQVNVKWSHPLY
jgi:hypothetical protein